MNKNQERLKFFALFTLFFVYVILISRRSLGLDEIQAIQISKENLSDIFQLLGYERHPIGWYLILKGVAVVSSFFGLSFLFVLKALQVCLLATTLSLIRKMSLSPGITLMLLVSPSLIIVPGLLLRPYLSANLLLIFAIMSFFRDRYARCLLILFFLCQLHVIYAILSFTIYLITFFKIKFRYILHQLLFLASFAFSLITAWPNQDSVAHVEVASGAIGDLPKGVLLSIAPFLGILQPPIQFVVSVFISIVALYVFLNLARSKKEVANILLCVVLTVTYSFTFLRGTQPWHLTFPIAAMVPILGSVSSEIAKSVLLRLSVLLLLFCQVLSITTGLSRHLIMDRTGGVDDFDKVYSIYCDGKSPIATNDHLAMFLSFKLERPIYNLELGAFQSFIAWKVRDDSSKKPAQRVDLSQSCVFSHSQKLEDVARNVVFEIKYENNNPSIFKYWVLQTR